LELILHNIKSTPSFFKQAAIKQQEYANYHSEQAQRFLTLALNMNKAYWKLRKVECNDQT